MLFLSQPQLGATASTSSGSSRLVKRLLLGSLKSLIREDSTSEGSKSQSEASTGLSPEASLQAATIRLFLTLPDKRELGKTVMESHCIRNKHSSSSARICPNSSSGSQGSTEGSNAAKGAVFLSKGVDMRLKSLHHWG